VARPEFRDGNVPAYYGNLRALQEALAALLEQRIGHRPEGVDAWEEGVFGMVGRRS